MNRRSLVLIVTLMVLTLASTFAFGAGPYYEGKVIRIIVGSAAGGGYDLYARALGRHLGKHIPGSPAIVVDNMPGAGYLVATNYMYKIAKPDGLTIGHVNAGLFLSELLQQPGIEFQGRKFFFIGSITKDNPVIIVNKSRGITNVESWVASKSPVKMGGVGTGSAQDSQIKVLQELIGLPVQLVSPFAGMSDIRLAMQKGEVDGSICPIDTLRMTMQKEVTAGDILVLMQACKKPIAGLPNVPLWVRFAKTDEARQVVQLWDTENELGKPFLVPPGTPNEIVQTLRRAFDETVKDKDFLAETQKANMGIDSTTGEEMQRNIEDLSKVLDTRLIPRLQNLFYK